MLFERRFWPLIADGSVTVTFRRWKRRQVVAGRRYRTAAGLVEVTAVDPVDPASIRDEDAGRAGYGSAAALLADLRGAPEWPVLRIEFHHVDEPDPRTELAGTAELTHADLDGIDRRLARLDRASPTGAWTGPTLDVVRRRPGVRAGDLADELGRERLAFKADVRKLKNLGLTVSLPVGYRLSPRGEAYVSRRRSAGGRVG